MVEIPPRVPPRRQIKEVVVDRCASGWPLPAESRSGSRRGTRPRARRCASRDESAARHGVSVAPPPRSQARAPHAAAMDLAERSHAGSRSRSRLMRSGRNQSVTESRALEDPDAEAAADGDRDGDQGHHDGDDVERRRPLWQLHAAYFILGPRANALGRDSAQELSGASAQCLLFDADTRDHQPPEYQQRQDPVIGAHTIMATPPFRPPPPGSWDAT